MARWTWIVDRGNAANLEPKDWAGTRYDQEELRECTHYISQMVSVSCMGRLVVDGLTPSPSFVSCISGCMRAIIPCTGALDCCIIC